MIHPTPGRIVWYYPSGEDLTNPQLGPLYQQPGLPLAAMVVGVHGERMVNLSVFDARGAVWARCSVPLLQDDDAVPGNAHCTWMPYQKQQAEKHATDALPASHPVQQLADAIGGTIEHVERLPDGSGAAIISSPLPKDHWLTQPGDNVPPMPFRIGTDNPIRQAWVDRIRAAGRYAVRCATMNGTEDDLDPDALVQQLIVGMIGYFTPDGLSKDAEANPPQTT